jgi:hypothetical protein
MKWGNRLFVSADSDTGYVHSIIPNYMCNLPYSQKPFILRIVLSLMDRFSVVSIQDYHLFTDRYYSSFELAQYWTNENESTHFVFSLYALVAPMFRAKQFT